MNDKLICTTCGTQMVLHFDEDINCPICSEERQYIPEGGQSWTTQTKLLKNSSVRIEKLTEQLYELTVVPTFAIGQRALLVLSDSGNILWDCIPLMDETTIQFIKSKGGLKAIAFSHPHYYSNMNDWAETFNCPIYIHKNDEKWIFDKEKNVNLWNGLEKLFWDGIKIINIGGHFDGSSILQVPFLSKKGTLLCGDTLYISPSLKHTAVMYSYPNRIPLTVWEVAKIKTRFEELEFDTIYGFYSYQNLLNNAKSILMKSLERYS